jgi:hypothetical protein
VKSNYVSGTGGKNINQGVASIQHVRKLNERAHLEILRIEIGIILKDLAEKVCGSVDWMQCSCCIVSHRYP